MYNIKDLKKTLFVNIQTVSQYNTLKKLYKLNPRMYDLWNKKMLMKYLKDRAKNMTDQELIQESVEYYSKSAWAFPEYGKINGISVGVLLYNKELTEYKIHQEVIHGTEEEIIHKLYAVIDKFQKIHGKIFLAGFNLKGNIIPYICKRSIINSIPLHSILDLRDVKPWESPFIDTMELWRFGDFNFTAFEIMCGALDIKSNIEYLDYGQFSIDFHEGKIPKEQMERILIENNAANIEAFLKINKG